MATIRVWKRACIGTAMAAAKWSLLLSAVIREVLDGILVRVISSRPRLRLRLQLRPRSWLLLLLLLPPPPLLHPPLISLLYA